MKIHPTAIISKLAKLADDIEVAPHTIIGDEVAIGKGAKIGANVVLEGNTRIGDNCQIFTGAVIGSRPQDLKYSGEKTYLEIGNNNIIREYCTFNPGTKEGGGKTVVGNDNLFMAYSHIAHDCKVGNNCIFANNGTLAGHVTVEDKSIIGGLVAVHQFVRVGRLSIVGGCSKVVHDIPPFSTCDGHPAMVYGLNLIGLRRNNISKESIKLLHQVFSILFNSSLTVKSALERIEKEVPEDKEVSYLIDFVKGSHRGLARSCRIKEE